MKYLRLAFAIWFAFKTRHDPMTDQQASSWGIWAAKGGDKPSA
ncbi:MAG: hypothetical protein RLZZ475_2538 [Pseudomonadota bacterium]|jgi:hypothetical protein